MLARRHSALGWTIATSIAIHLIVGGVGHLVVPDGRVRSEAQLVDIEIAPVAPEAEALPAERATAPEEGSPVSPDEPEPIPASTLPEPTPSEPTYAIDAGVDAPPPIDARPDAAPVDAKPIDAAPDAEAMIAVAEAGEPDADVGAIVDAGELDADVVAAIVDAGEAAAGSGSGSNAGSGSDIGSGSIALETGSGSGRAGQTDEPAVDGAPTTAGTAANLLTYFPQGHVITALIRFDRLRGTEWAAQTERLLRPMPDYQVLFGTGDAKIIQKLESLTISTPRPRDAAATTLVARTALSRSALRDFLGAAQPVTWSAAKGGLVGKRTGTRFKGDKRVFISPFRGWFMLAQPEDLPALTAATKGDLDAIEAKGKLPAWLGNIRSIEQESGGDGAKGPALVVTIATPGQRFELAPGEDFGLGVTSLPTPDRVSLAMELVKQGWLVRGNMRFGSEKLATEFIYVAESVQLRVGDSRVLQAVMGKPLARVVGNLSFARTGGRVSYATSVSISDARFILDLLAKQLDVYFRATASP